MISASYRVLVDLKKSPPLVESTQMTPTRLTQPMEAVDTEMAALLASKTESERLRIGWGMWRSARTMIRRLLRSEHPDWTVDEIDAEVARRLASGT